jgi:hypothetical protein
MAHKLPPSLSKLFHLMDGQMASVLADLAQMDDDTHQKATEALKMGLALRLVTFALGPTGQHHSERIAPLALDMLQVIDDLRRDLANVRPT